MKVMARISAAGYTQSRPRHAAGTGSIGRMRAGLTTSVILHAAVLGFGLFTLSAPRAFDVADVEALAGRYRPGRSRSPRSSRATRRRACRKSRRRCRPRSPDIVPDAKKIGDNSIDTDKPPTPEAKPQAGRNRGRARSRQPEPTPEAARRSQEAAGQAGREPKPADAAGDRRDAEAAAQAGSQARPGRRDDRRRQRRKQEDGQLPDRRRRRRPGRKPPQARDGAKAPDRKDADKPTEQKRASRNRRRSSSTPTRSRRCSTRRRPSGGGAKRSTDEAALGGDKTTNRRKLTPERDGCVARPGAALLEHPGRRAGRREHARSRCKFKLDPSGALVGQPGDHLRRRIERRGARRRRSRAARGGPLRSLQSASREIRGLGGRDRAISTPARCSEDLPPGPGSMRFDPDEKNCP